MPKIRGVKPEFWTDEDIAELSIPARLLLIGLWNYACDNGHLQDKPKQIKMRLMPGDDVNVAEILRELAASGRITRADGWITCPNLTFHQKPDLRYFTTCDKDGCDDPPEKVSQRKSRRVHAVHTPGTPSAHDERTECAHVDGDGDGDGDGERKVNVSRELTLPDGTRADIDRLCEHLADRIEANGANRPTIGKTWHDAARLMLDRDGRAEDDVHRAIDWCQRDEFWRANILSMPKLREKYDQLRMHAQRHNGTTRQRETDDLFARAARRMGIEGT